MNILAVDDEDILLDFLSEMLKKLLPGVDVYSCNTASEALECAAQRSISVAFLDIEIGEMNGIELAKRIKDMQNEVNIVFVTGYSEYAMDALDIYASGYLVKPISEKKILKAMENLRFSCTYKKYNHLRVQCFGNFEIFYKGKPIAFPRKKSKELFAYLVDRRGAQVTMAEIASILWEDGEYSVSRNNQIHTFIHCLINTLDEIGAKDVVIRKRNAISVDVTKIDCDLYHCLGGNPAAIHAYSGEYMNQYSWAEFTTGALFKLL